MNTTKKTANEMSVEEYAELSLEQMFDLGGLDALLPEREATEEEKANVDRLIASGELFSFDD